jgi:hypothetical protein
MRSFLGALVLMSCELIMRTAPAGADILPDFSILKNLDGPVVWTSLGVASAPPAGRQLEPRYWRGGLGLRFVPTVDGAEVLTLDSIDTLKAAAGTSTKATYKNGPKQEKGRLGLSFGYMVDNGARFRTVDFVKRLELRGPYVGAFGVPYKWNWGGRMGLVVGAAVEFLSVDDTHLAVGDTAIKVSGGKAVAPEGYVGVFRDLGSEISVFLEASWQYVRLKSIDYAGEGGAPISPALLSRLPREAGFRATHVTLGFTFSAKGGAK